MTELVKENLWVLDIETTLDHNTIRLVGLYDVEKNIKYISASPGELRETIRTRLPNDAKLITWNGLRFDIPVLKRVWDVDMSTYDHIDGMILAKLLIPDHHSYKLSKIAEHLRCKFLKGVVSCYDTAPLEELCTYLNDDLNCTREVIEKLLDMIPMHKQRTFRRAYALEAKVAKLCQEQVEVGVYFDIEKAEELVKELKTKMQCIEEDLYNELPMWPIKPHDLHYPPKLQFKKDGSLGVAIEKYCHKYRWRLEEIDGQWCAISPDSSEVRPLPLKDPLVTHEKLSLADQTGIKAWLLSLGWEPEHWNHKRDPDTGKYLKTSPRITDKDTKEPCPNLKKVTSIAASDISDWLMLRSRLNVVESANGTGWLPRARENGCIIPSDADTYGANTARWTHRIIANIPRVKSAYGRHMRELFRARPGAIWVGWDASSLEACMEAHYLCPYDKAASAELMDGDPHTKNLEAIEPLRDRDHAKTLKYGITYGAQPAKVAGILGVPKTEGEYWFNEFWVANPALAKLREDTIAVAKTGRITAIDGRWIGIRSQHSALNALFQSAGAIVMKYAMVIANKRIHEKYSPLVARGLIRYHDEEIWECIDEQTAEEVGKIGCESIREAGRYLKLHVPLDAEYKIGKNWAEVH